MLPFACLSLSPNPRLSNGLHELSLSRTLLAHIGAVFPASERRERHQDGFNPDARGVEAELGETRREEGGTEEG
jgi:hypothetical protein